MTEVKVWSLIQVFNQDKDFNEKARFFNKIEDKTSLVPTCKSHGPGFKSRTKVRVIDKVNKTEVLSKWYKKAKTKIKFWVFNQIGSHIPRFNERLVINRLFSFIVYTYFISVQLCETKQLCWCKSHTNLFLEPTSTEQWGWSFLLKETSL